MHPASPPDFPPFTLSLQRALAALETAHPTQLPATFDALYRAFWVEHARIETAEVYGPVLEGVLGSAEAARVVQSSAGTEGKERLLRNTEMAIGEGAFGLPWFVGTFFSSFSFSCVLFRFGCAAGCWRDARESYMKLMLGVASDECRGEEGKLLWVRPYRSGC